jgi:2-phosphoglycerate kinase
MRELKRQLSHVFWIGGSPCSGKSSIATILAEVYGFCIYHVDEAFEEFRQRVTPKDQPMLYKWTSMSLNDLWMRPVNVLLQDAITCHRELFDMVLENLLRLPDNPILVEGTSLLPDRVEELLLEPGQGIWLVPTERFQRAQYINRKIWVEGILRDCQDPGQVLRNWIDRDIAVARWVVEKAKALRLPYIEINGKRSVAENASVVAKHLGLTKNLSSQPVYSQWMEKVCA